MPKTVQILVEVQLNEEGEVKSSHRPLTPADQEEMSSWPSGGLVQVAHAMLIETLRRESYLMALSHLSLGNPVGEMTRVEVEGLTRAHIAKMVDHFVGPAADEAMQRIQSAPE